MQSFNEGAFGFEGDERRNREQERRNDGFERQVSAPEIVDLVSPTDQKDFSSNQRTKEAKGERKTLLDWIDVSASAITSAATVAISYALFVLSAQQFQSAEVRQKHEIMSSYLSQMTQIQLNEEFKNLLESDEAKQIASAATLNTLRQLDDEKSDEEQGFLSKLSNFIRGSNDDDNNGEEKGQLLKFLYGANLVGQCQTDLETLRVGDCGDKVIDLKDAKLNGMAFVPPMPKLPGIDLVEASLAEADLSEVDLTKAKMSRVTLDDATLAKARLTQAEIDRATLRRTNLAGATLIQTNLSGSDLRDANLSGARLQKADLRNADLSGANLQEVSFDGAVYNEKTIFPTGFNREAHGMQLCTTPIDQKCESLK